MFQNLAEVVRILLPIFQPISLRPFPPEGMKAWKVDRRVGNVQNNDPSLVEPLKRGPAKTEPTHPSLFDTSG